MKKRRFSIKVFDDKEFDRLDNTEKNRLRKNFRN